MGLECFQLFERADAVFREFIVHLMERREPDVVLYLYDLVCHAPLDGERMIRWNALCDEVVRHLRARTVPDGYLCHGFDRPSLYAKLNNNDIEDVAVEYRENTAVCYRDMLVHYLRNRVARDTSMDEQRKTMRWAEDVPFAEALLREKEVPKWDE